MSDNKNDEEFNKDGDLTPLALRRYKKMLALVIEYFRNYGLLYPDKMSASQAAQFLDISPKALERRRNKGTSPKFYKDPNTGAVYYVKREIDEYPGFPPEPSKMAGALEAFSVTKKLLGAYRQGLASFRNSE